MRRRVGFVACMGAVVALALGGSAAFSSRAHTAAGFDFGDAPDGVSAGYTDASVIGAFPSKAASNGPRHALGKLHLGGSASLEADSKQVNLDTGDNGVSLGPLAACKQSTATLLIDARKFTAEQRKTGKIVINGWFDWNQNGKWGEGGCGEEWAIQNETIPMSTLDPTGIGTVKVKFTAGSQVQDFWYRISITAGQTFSDWTGASATPFADGETEDYHHRTSNFRLLEMNNTVNTPKKVKHAARRAVARPAAGAPNFEIGCDPNPAMVAHGGSVKIKWTISNFSGPDAPPIHGEVDNNVVLSSYGKKVNKAPNQSGAPKGEFVSDSWTFKSKKKDDRDNVLEVVTQSFNFSRPGSASQRLTCTVNVIHSPKKKKGCEVKKKSRALVYASKKKKGGSAPCPPTQTFTAPTPAPMPPTSTTTPPTPTPTPTPGPTGTTGPQTNGSCTVRVDNITATEPNHMRISGMCTDNMGKSEMHADTAGQMFMNFAQDQGQAGGCQGLNTAQLNCFWSVNANNPFSMRAQMNAPPADGVFTLVLRNFANAEIFRQVFSNPQP